MGSTNTAGVGQAEAKAILDGRARLAALERDDPVRIVNRTLSIYSEIIAHAESLHHTD